MTTFTRRRRPIFNRRRGIMPILKAAALTGAILGVGGAGFAAGLKVSQAKTPATFAKPVMSAQVWP